MKSLYGHTAEEWRFVLIIQLFVLNVFASWSLGGIAEGAMWGIGIIGWSTVIALCFRYQWVLSIRPLKRLCLWGLFVVYILISIWNLQAERIAGFPTDSFRFVDYIEFLPAAVLALDTWEYLVMYSGIAMACISAYYCIQRRTDWILFLRLLFLNYAVLVFIGFIFKISGTAKVLGFLEWRGGQTFFASFRYHNNWAAYALIGICIGLALIYNEVQQGKQIFGRRSSGLLYVVSIFFMAVSIPSVGSRSGTSLLLIICIGVLFNWIVLQKNTSSGGRVFRALAACALISVAVTLVYSVGEESVHKSISKTLKEIERAKGGGTANLRSLIWEETIRVGMMKPWLGWGWGSYKRIFIHETHLYFRDLKPGQGRGISLYAHNDWLQHWFELGVIGFLFLLSVPVGFLYYAIKNGKRSPVGNWLYVACLLTLVYALVDLPFGCPAVLTIFSVVFVGAAKYSIIEKSRVLNR